MLSPIHRVTHPAYLRRYLPRLIALPHPPTIAAPGIGRRPHRTRRSTRRSLRIFAMRCVLRNQP